MRISQLICDLIDAKMEVAEFFKKHERNPYRTAECEDQLSEARDRLDDALRDHRAEGISIAVGQANGVNQ